MVDFKQVYKGYKFRLYPTEVQREQLARTFGCCRYVYNWGLQLRTDAYHNEQKRINYYQTSAMLTQLKHDGGHDWLNDVSSVSLQQVLLHLQMAFANFWAKTSKYPKFKKKNQKQSLSFCGGLDNGRLYVAKLGILKVNWDSRFNSAMTSKTTTISMDSAGRYFVGFSTEIDIKPLKKLKTAVGIDLGLESFATLSNGKKFKHPKLIKAKQQQLRRLQKSLSRKKKGSKNRNKARLRLAKLHCRIADARQDFLQKLSTKIIRENQTIAVEDLGVRNMMGNHKLAGAIGDASWSEFIRQLTYKADWYGRTLVKIDRFYPSSKRCHDCGHVLDKLPLGIRSWKCPSCNISHDRDVNAAKNILAVGRTVLASGDGVRPKRSLGLAEAAIYERRIS
jgi:putative transposase